ncbi:unnamed protein product [Allacma fusca]|uniref:Major facilitator superfamily domain-containing protein 12-like n=1 Tax=Allacma fusca TaxID=39272 RepID=A0A8J2PTH3_9HEXA|nr:unnamed protein product [Allacma fusca]
MTQPSDYRLPLGQRLAYAVGHVQNDLFAAMWFSYLLLYLQHVVLLPETTAGMIFLIGQFCDGIITPWIAYESDRLNWRCYGKRKTTHLIGTVVISLTFPFVFTRCYGCENASYWSLVIYFVPLVCLFQSGWAAVQVSHLSLIPELTNVPKERDELNIIRYAFDILTDAAVYVITYFVLIYHTADVLPEEAISPNNADVFRNISFILLFVGVIFTGIFHVFTPEKTGTGNGSSSDDSSLGSYMIWKDWFKVASFYKIAIVFSVSRVITNILQAFIPLYLQEGTQAPQQLIATIPLIINLSGFVSSLLVKPILRCLSKKSLFMISAGCTFISCIWFAWDDPNNIRDQNIYIIAVLSGVGGSMMLVLALSLAADLIGENTESGGFVYGCMAFAEKIINGVTILAFQAGKGSCVGCTTYYRNVLCYGVCFFVMVNLLAVLCLNSSNLYVSKPILLDDESELSFSTLLDNKKKKYGAVRSGFQLFSKST